MSGNNRFTLAGDIVALWIPSSVTIADIEAITAAEYGDGAVVNLVGVADGEGLVANSINGFEKSTSTIDVPDYVGDDTGNVPGPTTYPDSSMEFYAHKSDSTIRTALADGASGYVVLAYGAAAAATAGEYEAFPAEVLTSTRMKAKNDAHKFRVSFSIGTQKDGAFAA